MKVLQAIVDFFRLMFGDSSVIPKPDLSPLGRPVTKDELAHGIKRDLQP